MINDEQTLGLKYGPMIAGLLGALLSMRSIANATLWSRITSMLLATAAAVFLAPAITEYWGFSVHMQNAVSFFTGLLILNFTAGLIDISKMFAENPAATLHDAFALIFNWRTGNSHTGLEHYRNDKPKDKTGERNEN